MQRNETTGRRERTSVGTSVEEMMSRHGPYQVDAGYRQFYVQDFDQLADTSSDAFWTAEAVDCRLAVVPYALGIATDTNGKVPVIVEVCNSEPGRTPGDWNHIAEGSLELTAGRLKLAGCPDGDVRFHTINASPGWHRVRVYSAGLSPHPPEVLYSGDSYLVRIWPAPLGPRTLLKRYDPAHSNRPDVNA
jgi:hypothetical protein